MLSYYTVSNHFCLLTGRTHSPRTYAHVYMRIHVDVSYCTGNVFQVCILINSDEETVGTLKQSQS